MKQTLFAVAVIVFVRLAIIGVSGPSVPPASGDTMVYHSVSLELSRSIAPWMQAGSEFGYRPPLYFAYLASIYHLVPVRDYRIGQVATMLLGVLTTLVLYQLLLARDGERSARTSFWIRGLLPSFVITDTLIMSEPLLALLQTSALLVLFAGPGVSRVRAVSLGVIIGACMLTREPALIYPAFFGGWLWCAGGAIRVRIRNVLLFGGALLLVLAPWLARNQMVWGHAWPLSYTAGPNLHIGNNPHATGAFVELRGHTPLELPWGGPRFNDWHRREAVAYIFEHPTRFFVLGFRKVAIFLFPRFLRDDLVAIYKAPPDIRTTLLSLVPGVLNAGLLVAGLVGFTFGRRDHLWWLSFVLLVYPLVTTFVAFAHPRFRDAAETILVYYAALFLTHWRTHLAEIWAGMPGARRRLWCAVSVVILLFLNWAYLALLRVGGSTF